LRFHDRNGYPKLVLFGVAPLLIWAWMRRPATSRSRGDCGVGDRRIPVRHDHGVYLAIASLTGIALAPVADPRLRLAPRSGLRRLMLLMLAPYAIYVQVHGGLLQYIHDGIAFSQREAIARSSWHRRSRLVTKRACTTCFVPCPSSHSPG
jgi:hypothetical protein